MDSLKLPSGATAPFRDHTQQIASALERITRDFANREAVPSDAASGGDSINVSNRGERLLAAANRMAAESVVRDAGDAESLATSIRRFIGDNPGAALHAQADQIPGEARGLLS